MTAGNILCAANAADPALDDAVVRTVARYKKLRPYLAGDFYPLMPHDASEHAWFAYQFHRPDMAAGMAIAFRRAASPYESVRLNLRGLDPEARYAIANLDTGTRVEATGRELVEKGMCIQIAERPESALVVYERIPAPQSSR